MGKWISVKEKLPDTPRKCEAWDDDAKVTRKYANSRVHPAIRRNRAGHWHLCFAVYTSGWCAGWHESDSLVTIEPEYWLDYPAFPGPLYQRNRRRKAGDAK